MHPSWLTLDLNSTDTEYQCIVYHGLGNLLLFALILEILLIDIPCYFLRFWLFFAAFIRSY